MRSVVPGSWSVVTTVRAPKAILDRFIAHHLSLGAERLFIYFDDPALAWTFDDPRVETTVCDDEYWSGGPRPVRVVGRQVVNSNAAKARTRSEWILHIDADELLRCEGGVSDALKGVPADFDSVKVKNVEAVYTTEPTVRTIFDTTLFRRPVPQRSRLGNLGLRLVLGDLAEITRWGLFGHTEGKSFVRVDSEAFVGIHTGKRAGVGRRLKFQSPRLRLLHFDCLSYEEFKVKHMRRIDRTSPVQHLPAYRKAQMWLIRDVAQTEGEPGLHRLYLRMNVFGPVRMLIARLTGYVIRLR